MRILLYSLNYSPELTGVGKYNGEMAEFLAGRGHAVSVVTAPPYYPEWKVSEGYRNAWLAKDSLDGKAIRERRCPLYVPQVPTGSRRVLHLGSFAASSAPVVLAEAIRFKPDLLFAVEPTIPILPAALLASRLAGAKAWMHVQDFEVDASIEMGILNSGPLVRSALSLERNLMRRFDVVSTISEAMYQRLAAKGVPGSSRRLFPNWVDVESIFPSEEGSSLRRELGILPSTCVALFSGTIGKKQGIEIIIEAARALQSNPGVLFVISGSGPERARLEQSAVGLANVLFLPFQPRERLNALLNAADIHLLPQQANAADLVMPSKLGGMLASGRPTLATADPNTEIANVVEGRGIVVKAGDVHAFVAALIALRDDPNLRNRFGSSAREYAVRCLGKDAILSRFEQDAEELCFGKKASAIDRVAS